MIKLSDSDLQNVQKFCELNKIEDVEKYIQYCFKKGYAIDKYGLINGKEPEVIQIEVEKIVEKIVDKPCDETKIKLLEGTLQTLKKELSLKNEKINQLEEMATQFKDVVLSRGAIYHTNSNLSSRL
jgi:5-methylcytosine-specific restriction endonuclease McrBC GTP-binding regulatory subunit McrB